MIVTRSSRDVERKQSAAAKAAGRNVWNTGYMGTRLGVPAPDSVEALYPDAYLVEQGPGVTLPPHFHVANEFQVILSGAGTFGHEPVAAMAVHYAGAYSPYGPILAGPEGIGYLTLRASYDPGARTMPAALPELRAAARRPRDMLSEPITIGQSQEVFALGPDGLLASHYHLPPDGAVTGPAPAGGGGQYWIVLDGEMQSADGAVLPPKSCVFVSNDEAAYRAAARPSGPLDVLVVQFPL
jgi:hypothetical protein